MNTKLKTNVTADDILITSGSQQGLDFAGKAFLDKGDVVLCESPSYMGALNAMKAYEPELGQWKEEKNLWKSSINMKYRL